MLPEDSSTQVITLCIFLLAMVNLNHLYPESNNPDLIPFECFLCFTRHNRNSLLSPISNLQGPVTITVTVEDGGLDGDLLTTEVRTTTDSINIYVRRSDRRSLIHCLSLNPFNT